jgi:hypothetical protein
MSKARRACPSDVSDLRTARATDRPCQLYAYHAPAVVQTEGHHRHPIYLQNRAYGRISDPELLWLCPNCHAAVHEWISYLLGERRRPSPEPGIRAKREAQAAVDWFRLWRSDAR